MTQVDAVLDDGIRLLLPRTGHGRVLGFDHVCEYTSDRIERGVHYGFLTLKVQLSIQGNDVHVTPTRPGIPVPAVVPPDLIRVSLLQRLHDFPDRFVRAGELNQSDFTAVVQEMARSDAEVCLRRDYYGVVAPSLMQWQFDLGLAARTGCDDMASTDPRG